MLRILSLLANFEAARSQRLLRKIEDLIASAFKLPDVRLLIILASGLARLSDRSNQLLGDRWRSKKEFDKALRAYEHTKDSNISGRYGEIECFKALNMPVEFGAALNRYFPEGSKISPTTASRLALAAAEMKDLQNGLRFLSYVEKAHVINDARHAFRIAKTLKLCGRDPEREAYGLRALELAGGDEDLILELSALDYDLDTYWEQRYQSYQAERTPVPVADQGDKAWRDRTERDIEFLTYAFSWLPESNSLGKVADVGCGSGRLTRFLAKRARSLDSFDVSRTAIEFARSTGDGQQRFHVKNLARELLDKNHYDLVFDFAAVQHFSDKSDWEFALRNYAQALRAGGHLLLIEHNGNDTTTGDLHVSAASGSTYCEFLSMIGLEEVRTEITPWADYCMLFRKNSV